MEHSPQETGIVDGQALAEDRVPNGISRLTTPPSEALSRVPSEYPPQITRLLVGDPNIRGILVAHPQIETVLTSFYEARAEQGPLAALDEVLRPGLRGQPLDTAPLGDLQKKVTLLQAVVGVELAELQKEPDDNPLKVTLRQRQALFAVAVDRYVQDHNAEGKGPRVRHRPEMGGDRFGDQLKASRRH